MQISNEKIATEYEKLMNRIRWLFNSETGFESGKNYVRGLLGPAERKNGWQMSESLGAKTPYKLQQFISRGKYSERGIMYEVRGYVGDELGEEDGVLVPDDTGYLKKGTMSCGVKRQYTGTSGKVDNCQIGVFLAYASSAGYAAIDQQLYMPEDWMSDKVRRDKAGVPEELEFQTKPEMALEMIKRATAEGIPYKWVTCDSAYGEYGEMRKWLEEKEKSYVVCVPVNNTIWVDNKKMSIGEVMKGLSEEGWYEESCGAGSKGEREYEWQAKEIALDWREIVKREETDENKRILLVRRSKSDARDMQGYMCWARRETTERKLIEIAGMRWKVETTFREMKSEVGMDEYEYQSYRGWSRHITFACVAMALLAVVGAGSGALPMQSYEPGSSSLAEFKKKHNLRA